MKLMYCFFEELYGQKKNVGITLTSEFIFTPIIDKEGNLSRVTVKNNEKEIKNFFHKNGQIEIAGIIGENGVGKSSILNHIIQGILEFAYEKEITNRYVFIFSDGNKLFAYNNYENLMCNDEIENCSILNCEVEEEFKRLFHVENRLKIKKIASGEFHNDLKELSEVYYHDKDAELLILPIEGEDVINYKKYKISSICRHIDSKFLDNLYILKTRKETKALDKYLGSQQVGIRPVYLEEFAQGDYKKRTDINTLIENLVNNNLSNVESNVVLNDREFYYVCTSYIFGVLEKNNKNFDKNTKHLMTHLLMDYLILSNNKDFNLIIGGLHDFLKNCKTVTVFFNKLIRLLSNVKSTRIEVDGNEIYYNEKEICMNFIKQVKEVRSFYNKLIKYGNTEDYYIIDIENKNDKKIVNVLLGETLVSKYFKVLNKVSLNEDKKIEEFPFSSGELHMIRLFARIYVFFSDENLKRNKNMTYLLLLDEPDTSLHPEWQRLFWSEFIELVKTLIIECKIKKNSSVQVLFTTHSPFLISDIPRYCLNILGKDNEAFNAETFNANIFDLFRESFFVKKPMGEFAYSKVSEFYKIVNKKPIEGERLDEEKVKNLSKLIDIVGEEIIKKDMQNKLNRYINERMQNDNSYKIELLRRQKESINIQIKELGGDIFD